jgi:hypothetical protein
MFLNLRLAFGIGLILISFSVLAKIETHKFEVDTKFGLLKIEVHFNSKNSFLAERIEDMAHKELISVVDYFNYTPKETVHFNIDTDLRLTNGNARSFPTNIVNLYNFPANNNEHLIVMEDWWKGLVLHEFTHIVHLEQTRSLWDVTEKIFGNISKIPVGIIPRWFAEGVAVWSESNFYKSGRLNNSLFNKELWIFLNESKNCSEIDCLDEPGIYPHGQLAYWIGAHFLNYIENLKPGTIRCLVEENSKRLPFLLNISFQTCTEKSVYEHFNDFKTYYINKFSDNKLPENTENIEIKNLFGETVFQRGVIFANRHVYKVERNRKEESLVSYDIDDNVEINQKYSHPIADLAGTAELNDEKELLVSFNEDPTFKISNKNWKLINAETLLIDKELNFKNDPSYVLPLNSEEYLTFLYKDNFWTFQKIKFNSKDEEKIESTYNFGRNENVIFAQIINKKIILKIFNHITNAARLVISDLDFKEPKIFYTSKKYFEIFNLGSNYIEIREDKEITRFIVNEESVYEQKISHDESEKLKEIIFIREVETTQLLLGKKLHILNTPKIQINLASSNKVELLKFNLEANEESKKVFDSYPYANHFKPHYWFFSFSNSQNESNLGAQTNLADPMGIHSLSLAGYYFDQIKKVGENINYVYDFEPYMFELSFLQDYSKTDISLINFNTSKKVDLNFSYKIEQKRHSFTPSLFFGIENVEDFISAREIKYFGIRGTWLYKSNSFSDLIKSLNIISRLAIDSPTNGNSFVNFQNRFEGWLQLNNKLTGMLRLSLGKLFKTDYSRGVIYAGGNTNAQYFRWFDFYGLPFGNAYGNKIFSSRMKIDYEWMDFYRGHELLPFYLKELHLVGGFENLNSEVVYLNNKKYKNESFNSFFGGLKTSGTLFYLAPVDLEFIISSTILPDQTNYNQISINLISEFI